MQKWAIGVFASVDAGLGVHLDVAKELGIHTVQVHTPHKESRNEAAAKAFLQRCEEADITITCLFGGFEGESYATLPRLLEPWASSRKRRAPLVRRR